MAKTAYYVTMVDTMAKAFTSKSDKLIFECDSYDQALIVEQNAINRGDQKYINIALNPKIDHNKYNVRFKTIEDYPHWYKENYFK